MLYKEKLVYSHWLKLYKNISKPERFGIGEKIDKLFLDALEATHEMRFAFREKKVSHLEKAISKIDKIKFFAEICWGNKLISTKDYSEFLMQLEEVGRILGGWKKGILKKNSQQ